MSARGWAIATVVAGVITFALFVVFGLLPETRAAADCLPPGAVILFELARDTNDLAAIFGPPGSTCRTLGAAAMDAINHIDLIAFIPAYTAFCISGALFLAGGQWGRPLAAAAVAVAILAALADVLETTTLLDISQNLDALGDLLVRSQFGAWSKFALLAAHALFCAGLCFTSSRRRWILGFGLVLPTLGVAAAASNHIAFTGVMNMSFTIAWVALLVFAAISAVRAKDASA